MGAHTANPGKVYFAAGTPDREDARPDGTLDLAGSVTRELCEETGLELDEIAVEESWTAVILPGRIAFMRPVSVPLPAAEARALMLSRMATQAEPELSDIVIVRDAGDADRFDMPPFMRPYLDHIWRAGLTPRSRCNLDPDICNDTCSRSLAAAAREPLRAMSGRHRSACRPSPKSAGAYQAGVRCGAEQAQGRDRRHHGRSGLARFRQHDRGAGAGGRALSRVGGVFYNLTGADTNEALQAIEREMSPVTSRHWSAIMMDPALFARVDAVFAGREALGLDAEQMRLLERTHRGFIRSGAQLAPDDKTAPRRDQ
jgi:8-oxo-dGTP pyrophosphatase MutT (NUDIX family)